MEKTKLELLIESWNFDKENARHGYDSYDYISALDKILIENDESFKQKFKTHIIPKPWWGNIKNPDVIILALNPSYEPIIEELENSIFKDDFLDNLESENKTINFLDKEKYQLTGEKLKSKTGIEEFAKTGNVEAFGTYSWWKKVFSNNNEELIIDKENLRFGVFNLCGYHSKSYETYKYNGNYLPTTIRMGEYVKQLIDGVRKDYNKMVIVIWGKWRWEEIFGEDFFHDLEDQLLIVNKDTSTRNKVISAAKDTNLKNKVMEILKNRQLNPENLK